jgi:hypothetical protein
MPERKHNLLSHYDWLDGQISDPVLDSIVVYERSHGVKHLPGEYGAASPPPAHRIKVVGTDTENAGCYTERRNLGSAEHYTVVYDVWNHRDSPPFAEIILLDEAE